LKDDTVNTQEILSVLPRKIFIVVKVLHDWLAKVTVVLKRQFVSKSKTGVRKNCCFWKPPLC